MLSSCGENNHFSVKYALTAGFFHNAARFDGKGVGYRTLKNNSFVSIHPSSVVMVDDPLPRVVLYYELVEISKEYMRSCMPIEAVWLALHVYKKNTTDSFEKRKLPGGRHVAKGLAGVLEPLYLDQICLATLSQI